MKCYYNENHPQKAAWLRELIKRDVVAAGDIDERSILEVRASDLLGYTQCHFFAGIGIWSYALRLAGWPEEKEVWTGSCPCQPFSVAGHKKAEADERHLWPAWFRLITERRPGVVFGEQVADGDGITWLDNVQTNMESIPYRFGALVLPAAGFGAPHARHRTYFVADTNEARAWRRTAAKPGSDGEGNGILGADGKPIGMADADEMHSEQLARKRAGSGGTKGAGPLSQSAGCGNAGGVADASGLGGQPGLRDRESGGSRGDVVANSGADGGLGDAKIGGLTVGRDETESERSGHADSASESRDMDHSKQEGPQRRCVDRGDEDHPEERNESGSDGPASPASGSGRLGDAKGITGGLSNRPEERRETSEPSGPSAVGGFWANAEWIPTRGKVEGTIDWRPIEPKFIALPHGTSAGILPSGNSSETSNEKEEEIGGQSTKTNSLKAVPTVQGDIASKAPSEAPGGLWGVQASPVLQQEVHGEGDGKSLLHKPVSQSSEGASIDRQDLRGLQNIKEEATSPPQRREPEEQYPVEFEDFVRLLPQSYALAELHGDEFTKEALLTLLKASGAERLLQYTSYQIEKAWRSIDEESKNRLKLGFEKGRWMRSGEFALTEGTEARILRLCGYGDGIVAPVAQAFIEAYLDTLT